MNRKIFTSYISLLLLLPFIGCVRKNSHAADYFERYFKYQDFIQTEFKDDPVRGILYGNPEADSEEKFYKKDGYLALSFRLSETGGRFRKELSDSPLSVFPESPYSIFVKTEPAEFYTKPIYKITRTTEMLSPEVSVFDVFPLIDETIEHLRKSEPNQVLEHSSLQKFLCHHFDCEIKKENGELFLSYTLSERMKEQFPIAYKKWNKRLGQVSFRFQLFQPGGFTKGWEFYNEGKKLILGIPDSPKGYWASPKTLYLRTYLFINVFGLKIDIRGLGYTLKFSRSGNTDTVTGYYSKIPETTIGGRFLSIFPPGAVNFFIPGNMDEYFEGSFKLMVEGSDGKGGTRFENKTKRNGNKTKVVLTTESEIFRDRFLPFKSSDEDDEPAFFPELGKNIVLDLRGR
ncbi:LIC10025 family lipoprotein [Leptospira sp. SA-E8]|uniref:LIC10025 family lipoprotein n=1 Tax=Leptospira sp. SA-E8 TaxID=3422259 RepID=UPI003EB9E4E1